MVAEDRKDWQNPSRRATKWRSRRRVSWLWKGFDGLIEALSLIKPTHESRKSEKGRIWSERKESRPAPGVPDTTTDTAKHELRNPLQSVMTASQWHYLKQSTVSA